MGYGKRKTHRPLALPVTFARAELIFLPIPHHERLEQAKDREVTGD